MKDEVSAFVYKFKKKITKCPQLKFPGFKIFLKYLFFKKNF